MSQLSPVNQPSQGAKPADAPVGEPGFEVAAHEFWVRNRNFILLLVAVALLVIAGREGWDYLAAGRETDLQADYARAADSSDRLIAFADAHAGHALAGVAYLRVADEKFVVADYKAAVTYYTKAAANLQNDALLGRARLGSAVSQLNGGDQVGGQAALAALSNDATALKGARAEATYHLASIALGAGKTDEARKFAEQVGRIDENGPWAQRAAVLLAGLPVAAAPAAATAPAVNGAAPAFNLKPADAAAKPPGK